MCPPGENVWTRRACISNFRIGPLWRERNVWTKEANLTLSPSSLPLPKAKSSSLNINLVIEAHVYLHFLDKKHVLIASFIGKQQRILSLITSGRLLMISAFATDLCLFFWELPRSIGHTSIVRTCTCDVIKTTHKYLNWTHEAYHLWQ